jgi:hypothetical protein
MSQSATGARPITHNNNDLTALNSKTHAHLQNCLRQLKASIESRISYTMLNGLMKSIKSDQFREPTLDMAHFGLFNSQKKHECQSVSTRDSDSGCMDVETIAPV